MTTRKLRIEELEVESFATSRGPEGRGTVRAHHFTAACTPNCSDIGETCDDFCTLSMPLQRECLATDTCPNDCGNSEFC